MSETIFSDTELAAFAIADRLDVTPCGTARKGVWPLPPQTSAIGRISATADRIRERAESGEVDDATRQAWDRALADLLAAVEKLEDAA